MRRRSHRRCLLKECEEACLWWGGLISSLAFIPRLDNPVNAAHVPVRRCSFRSYSVVQLFLLVIALFAFFKVTELLLCADSTPESMLNKALEVVATQCYTKVLTGICRKSTIVFHVLVLLS